MTLLLRLVCFSTCFAATVSIAGDRISATGTLFITFDIGINEELVGVLYARLVPDGGSIGQFPLMVSDSQPGPVLYVSFEAPDLHLDSLVGREEATRLSSDLYRVVAVPVSIQLTNLRMEVECDYPVYYATLISVQSAGAYRLASRDGDAPVGC